MEWSNYINPIFIVHNSLYSVLVNIIRDACFYGYTALPNCFYLVNNVFNFNVFFTIAGFFCFFYSFTEFSLFATLYCTLTR